MASVPHEETDLPEPAETHSDDRRSTFGLLKNVALDLTQVVEDSTELIGASVREELAQFREDMARHMLSLVAIVIGGALVTAGLAMLVSRWIGDWSLTLLMFGGIYFGVALLLRMGSSPDDDEGWK